jgi:hypothetical protein
MPPDDWRLPERGVIFMTVLAFLCELGSVFREICYDFRKKHLR